jgi:hypothetical protein
MFTPFGFPIRKSPDHSLLAAPRSLSQLITSFFAYLRLGIHTHALSSLTIKSTSHTRQAASSSPVLLLGPVPTSSPYTKCSLLLSRFTLLVFCNARQIFSCQRSRSLQQSVEHWLYELLSLAADGRSPLGFPGGPRWNRTTDLILIRDAL